MICAAATSLTSLIGNDILITYGTTRSSILRTNWKKKVIFLKIITIITLWVVYYDKTKFSSFNFARVLAFLSNGLHEFSIGWKFMRLGITWSGRIFRRLPFKIPREQRENISWPPCERSVLSNFFCRSKIRPPPCERSLIKPPFTSREHSAKSTSVIHFSGGSREEAEGGSAPLYLHETETRRAEKKFFWDRDPLLSKGPNPPLLFLWFFTKLFRVYPYFRPGVSTSGTFICLTLLIIILLTRPNPRPPSDLTLLSNILKYKYLDTCARRSVQHWSKNQSWINTTQLKFFII